MEYVIWLTIFIILPTVFLWVLNWKYLTQYWKPVIYCAIWALIFSIPWDIWAVYADIWRFHEGTNIGLPILGLPIEEYLFMILVTAQISTVVLLIRKRIDARHI